MSRRHVGRALAVTLALTSAAAACSSGGGSGDKEKEANSKEAPEDKRAPAGEVTAGLGRIDAAAKRIAGSAGTDDKTAKDLADSIEGLWFPIEGTVRANDKDLYIRFEDDFAAVGKAVGAGRADNARRAATDISSAVKAYLEKFSR